MPTKKTKVDDHGRRAEEFRDAVVVHNSVRHGRDTPGGLNGFRWFWSERTDPILERCDCGWRLDRKPTPHYRVKLGELFRDPVATPRGKPTKRAT